MSVTESAIERVKSMILSGALKPGDKLPPEGELAAQFGLSRSSMREAFKALEAMRILDVKRGDGTYVTSLDPSLLIEAFSFVVSFHETNAVLEVLEARRHIEPAVAALAAQRATAEDVAALREILCRVSEDTSSQELVENDILFHKRLAEAAQNSYFCSLLEAISSSTTRARVWRGIRDSGSIERTLAEHERILNAIAAGDAELAKAAMTVHVCGVEAWFREQAAAAQAD